MRVAEADLVSIGEKILVCRVERRLEDWQLVHEVYAEIRLGADDELCEVLQRHVYRIPRTFPPDSGMRVKTLLRERTYGQVADRRLVQNDIDVVRTVSRVVHHERQRQDVVELHHVPVVVGNAVCNLHVGPFPECRLERRNAAGGMFGDPRLQNRVKLARLVYDVVVDRLHGLEAEKRLQVAVVEVRRDVAREDPRKIGVKHVERELRRKFVAVFAPLLRRIAGAGHYLAVDRVDYAAGLAVRHPHLVAPVLRREKDSARVFDAPWQLLELRPRIRRHVRALSAEHDRRHFSARTSHADNRLAPHVDICRVRLPVHEKPIGKRPLILRDEGRLDAQGNRRDGSEKEETLFHGLIVSFGRSVHHPLLRGSRRIARKSP